MNNFGFGNLQFIPGVGYVQAGSGAPANFARRTGPRGLGDEGAVMMISGIGNVLVDPNAVAAEMRAAGKSEAEVAAAVAATKLANDSMGPYGLPPGVRPPGIAVPPSAAPLPQLAAGGLHQRLTLFNVTLPVWAWLAIAALLGGAGGATLSRMMK